MPGYCGGAPNAPYQHLPMLYGNTTDNEKERSVPVRAQCFVEVIQATPYSGLRLCPLLPPDPLNHRTVEHPPLLPSTRYTATAHLLQQCLLTAKKRWHDVVGVHIHTTVIIIGIPQSVSPRLTCVCPTVDSTACERAAAWRSRLPAPSLPLSACSCPPGCGLTHVSPAR